MSRLFWLGTGVALTVVVVVKGRRVVRRYAPATLVDQATATAQATGSALSDAASRFLDDFRSARDERAEQLSDSLLARTQGSVDDLRARRDATSRPGAARPGARGPGRHSDLEDTDDDELGYSF